MTYNKPMLAVVLGSLSSIVYELLTRVLVAFDFGKYSVYHLVSLMVTLDRPTIILGVACGFIVSGFIALAFYYSLDKLGWDYLIYKSVAVSLIFWIVLESIFMWLIEGRNLIPHRPVDDYYSEMLGAIAFGITQGLLFKKYLSHSYIKDE